LLRSNIKLQKQSCKLNETIQFFDREHLSVSRVPFEDVSWAMIELELMRKVVVEMSQFSSTG